MTWLRMELMSRALGRRLSWLGTGVMLSVVAAFAIEIAPRKSDCNPVCPPLPGAATPVMTGGDQLLDYYMMKSPAAVGLIWYYTLAPLHGYSIDPALEARLYNDEAHKVLTIPPVLGFAAISALPLGDHDYTQFEQYLYQQYGRGRYETTCNGMTSGLRIFPASPTATYVNYTKVLKHSVLCAIRRK